MRVYPLFAGQGGYRQASTACRVYTLSLGSGLAYFCVWFINVNYIGHCAFVAFSSLNVYHTVAVGAALLVFYCWVVDKNRYISIAFRL